IWRVSASGGEASPIVSMPGRIFGLPSFLPDDKHFLFVADAANEYDVYVGSLDAAPDRQTSTRLGRSGSQVIYVPSADSGPGWLLSMQQQDTLIAQRFDPDRLAFSGNAIPLGAHLAIRPIPGYGSFSMSPNGVLAYQQAGGVQLTWFDRQGRPINRF